MNVLGGDPQPAAHRTSPHLHETSVCRRDELVGVRWVGTNQQTALTAGRDRHVATDEEGKSAEHLLLGHVRFAGHQLANPTGKVFVIRHGAIVRTVGPAG